MKTGECAKLKMEKVLCKEGAFDEKVFECELLKNDKNKERIYMLLKNAELTEISLDAIYRCDIQSLDGPVQCVGRVAQRYCAMGKKILEFQIKNGFYKINLKLVDK